MLPIQARSGAGPRIRSEFENLILLAILQHEQDASPLAGATDVWVGASVALLILAREWIGSS